MRIICIDDDATFLTLYRKALEKVIQPEDDLRLVESGEEALRLQRESRADLVITDMVMPGLSGLELIDKIRTIDPTTEVVVVTGQGSIESAVEAMRRGARDYITKPINIDVLAGKISTMRDLLGRLSEAEDYRHAKETIEANAMHTIAQMETRIDRSIGLVADLKKVLNAAGGAEEHNERVRALISQYEQEVL